MAGFKSDPSVFINKYPHHPAVAINSLEEMKLIFDKNEPLAFYYPAIPSEFRDNRTLDILEYFSNSIMLAEKPSHSRLEDAINFKKKLADQGINENRFFVGMHSPLHPARQVML